MDTQLTSNEINAARELLGDYAPAKHALDVLEKHNGNCDTSFDELWIEQNGVVVMPEGRFKFPPKSERLKFHDFAVV